MPLALAVVLLAAASTSPTLAVPAFSAGKPEIASFCAERAADELGRAGYRVVSERQVAALLGIERQKQLLGCASDSSECIAELTGALGADALISGSIAQLGSRLVLDVRVFSARTGERLGAVHGEAASEDELPEVLTRVIDELVPVLSANFNPHSPPRRGPGLAVWLPLGLGVLSGVGSAISFGVSAQAHGVLTDLGPVVRPLTFDEAARTSSREGVSQTAGWVLLGVAALTLATALLVWVTGS